MHNIATSLNCWQLLSGIIPLLFWFQPDKSNKTDTFRLMQ